MRRVHMTLLLLGALNLARLQAQTTVTVSLDRLDAALDEILGKDLEISVVRQDYFGANEGPAWVKQPQGGYLIFSDMGANRIYKWDPAAKQLSVHLEKSGYTGTDLSMIRGLDNGRLIVALMGSNGIALDADGRLVMCTHGDRALVRIEKDGTRTTLVDRFEGKRLNGPNDLAIRKDGSVYFTDFGAVLRGGFAKSPDRELDFQGAFRWKPDGSVQLVSRNVSNGIAFSPDEKYAYTTGGGGVQRYEVHADGSLVNPTKFVDRGADGIKVDSRGFIYGSHGWIANPQGKVLGGISLPPGDNPTNLTFGDADGRGIYYVTLRSVYHVRMKRSAW